MEGQQIKVERQVPIQLAALCVEIGRLHDQLGELEERLSSVRRGVDGTKSAEEPQQELVPLANQIRGYAERVANAVARLQDIMARLEL